MEGTSAIIRNSVPKFLWISSNLLNQAFKGKNEETSPQTLANVVAYIASRAIEHFVASCFTSRREAQIFKASHTYNSLIVLSLMIVTLDSKVPHPVYEIFVLLAAWAIYQDSTTAIYRRTGENLAYDHGMMFAIATGLMYAVTYLSLKD